LAIEKISWASATAKREAQVHAAKRMRADADCLNPVGRNRIVDGRDRGTGKGLQ